MAGRPREVAMTAGIGFLDLNVKGVDNTGDGIDNHDDDDHQHCT
jgi:hypothetical protein